MKTRQVTANTNFPHNSSKLLDLRWKKSNLALPAPREGSFTHTYVETCRCTPAYVRDRMGVTTSCSVHGDDKEDVEVTTISWEMSAVVSLMMCLPRVRPMWAPKLGRVVD